MRCHRTGTLDEFKHEVEAEREVMKSRHTEEQAQFKEEIFNYAKKVRAMQRE